MPLPPGPDSTRSPCSRTARPGYVEGMLARPPLPPLPAPPRLPPPSRGAAARRGTARMAGGSGSVVLPRALARRAGLTAGRHADVAPVVGPLIGLRDLAIAGALLGSLNDPVRLRVAVTVDSVVQAADEAALALPLAARRAAARAVVSGSSVALRGVAA